MSKLQVGDLCLFDILNKTAAAKTNGTIAVKIVKITHKLFRKTVYNCVSINNGNIIDCNKELLLKVNDIDTKEPPVMIRFDEDSPIITDSDIKTVKDVISMTSTNSDINIKLQILLIKLEYYGRIKDV